MNCAEVQDLIDLYVLGALEADVADQIEAHVATCPACQAQIERAWTAAQLLRLSVPSASPSEGLRGRILSAAGRPEGQAAPLITPAPLARTGGGLLSWLRGVIGGGEQTAGAGAFRWATAAAVLPLALTVWLALQVVELQGRMHSTERAMEESRQTAHVATEIMGRAMETGGSMARLAGMEMAPSAHGAIYYVPSDEYCLLVAQGLPILRRDQVYQVWLVSGDKRVSGGFLWPEEGGQGMLVVKSPMPLEAVDSVGLSVEPRGGSEQPQTGSRAIWGRLRTRT